VGQQWRPGRSFLLADNDNTEPLSGCPYRTISPVLSHLTQQIETAGIPGQINKVFDELFVAL